jgi:hypothetical protein
VALEAPPDENLDELMRAEEQRDGRQQQVITPAADVSAHVDADPGDEDPGDRVCLGREAHVPNPSDRGVTAGAFVWHLLGG